MRCSSGWSRQGTWLDPTLGVAEAYAGYFSGNAGALNRTLVQQAVAGNVLKATREFVAAGRGADTARAAIFQSALEQATANLLRAWKAGVALGDGDGFGKSAGVPRPLAAP